MPESTFAMPLADLYAEAGNFLGWGRGPAFNDVEWSEFQLQDLKSVVKSGLSRFYFQAQADARDPAYQWTFMRPVATITIPSGERTLALPEDFGGFEHNISVQLTSGSSGFMPVKLTQEAFIRDQYARYPSVTGRPLFAADQVVKGTTPTRSSRRQVYVYPEPDQSYDLSFQYYLLPNMLTETAPFAYGGAAHGDTLKAAVRAACELFLDNVQGPEEANYQRAIASSIAYDRRHQPKTLGVNTDRSDVARGGYANWPQGLWGWLDPVTFNGSVP